MGREGNSEPLRSSRGGRSHTRVQATEVDGREQSAGRGILSSPTMWISCSAEGSVDAFDSQPVDAVTVSVEQTENESLAAFLSAKKQS